MSQDYKPLTQRDIKESLKALEKNKTNKIGSRITWQHEFYGGNIINKKIKICQDNYDRDGTHLETEYFNKEGLKDSIIVYNYESNKLKERINFDPKGTVKSKNIYSYYEDGLIKSIFCYINDDFIYKKEYFFYDKKTNSITNITQNSNDSLINKTVYFLKDSLILKREYYDESNNLIYLVINTYEENLIKEQIYNYKTNGNNFKLKFTYTPTNKISEIKKEMPDGKIINTYIYKYNSLDNIVGYAVHEGEVIFHSKNTDYDVLNADKSDENKKIIKLLKYTYKYY
jgi:hypothetical protein